MFFMKRHWDSESHHMIAALNMNKGVCALCRCVTLSLLLPKLSAITVCHQSRLRTEKDSTWNTSFNEVWQGDVKKADITVSLLIYKNWHDHYLILWMLSRVSFSSACHFQCNDAPQEDIGFKSLSRHNNVLLDWHMLFWHVMDNFLYSC